MSDVENAKIMLKALKKDYDMGGYTASEYLRLKNSYETALKQALERESGK